MLLRSFFCLSWHTPHRDHGPIAIVGPGTGLGVSFRWEREEIIFDLINLIRRLWCFGMNRFDPMTSCLLRYELDVEKSTCLNFEKASHAPFAPKNEVELQVCYKGYICFNFDLLRVAAPIYVGKQKWCMSNHKILRPKLWQNHLQICEVEHVCSGPGLVHIYDFLCVFHGIERVSASPAEVRLTMRIR